MLRVFIDRGNAHPKTGIGVYSDSLIGALVRKKPNDIKVINTGVSGPATNLRPLRRLLYLWRLNSFLNSISNMPAIIHFTNQYVPRRRGKLTYIVTIHDLDPMMMPEAHSNRYSAYFSFFIKNSINRAHFICTDSEFVRQELLEKFLIDESKVKCLSLGLSYEFKFIANKTTKNHPTTPTILYIGQLSMKKNIKWLVETIAKGIESNSIPFTKLILAGNQGFGFSDINKTITKVGKKFVTWHKSPSLEKIVDLYKSSSALVLPSLREGFGIPLLEAMYCDLPIIASCIPTSKELAGEVACFFQLDNEPSFYEAVNKALKNQDSEKRRYWSKKQLEKYNWDNLVDSYIKIYKENSTSL